MRPTREGSRHRGLVTSGFGYSPEEPVGEPVEPVDYLQDENARAWYPVSGGGTTGLVQSKVELPGSSSPINQSVSFDDPVTAGSLLVVLIATRSFGGAMTGPVDWSAEVPIDTNGFNSGDGALFYKIADGTEGVGPFTFGTGAATQRRITMAEFSGPNGFVDSASTTGGASSSYTIGDVTPTATEPATLIAAALNSGTITGVTGYTTVSNGLVEGGINGPASILAYKAVDPASGDYNATVTQSSVDIRGGVHLAFSSFAEPAWIPAPLTIDDDDATYHEVVGHEECWRAQLLDSYQIGRARLVIGTETSGSKTYDLEGQTLADIDAGTGTVIGTFSFTATGSYTADTIEISMDGAAGFEFYRLVGPDENRRIYTVNLYNPGVGGGVSVHEELTGREDPDQHPADAVSVVPFDTIAATDVQAALEEIFAEASGAITVEDGTTSVTPVDTIVFDGATVTDDGGGQVTVEIEGGGAGGGELVAADVFLTSPVTMTNANQYYDGPSVSLPAGTYLVWATVDLEISQPGWFTARLWDGTNVFAEAEGFVGDAGEAVAVPLHAKITLTTTTTIKASAAGSVTGGTILDTANFNATADKLTKLSWVNLSTPGLAREFDYAQITSNVTVNQSAEASAVTVVTGNAVTYDGSTTVLIEFQALSARPAATSGGTMGFWLYDGSSSIGRIGAIVDPGAGSNFVTVRVARRLTPSAGAHTYSIRATDSSTAGIVLAGAGGSGNDTPAFIRITEVVGAGTLPTIRTLRGKITGSTGAVAQGSGFTCVRNSTGDYTITITSAFTAAPIVVATVNTTAAARVITVDTITTTSIHVYIVNLTPSFVDHDFNFVAMEAG